MKDKKSKEDYLHLIPDLKSWLGENGLGFFKEIKQKYGQINAVFLEGVIPHSVHFREGMQVRNKLRDLTNYSWTAHEYDNTWSEIIDECIKEQTC